MSGKIWKNKWIKIVVIAAVLVIVEALTYFDTPGYPSSGSDGFWAGLGIGMILNPTVLALEKKRREKQEIYPEKGAIKRIWKNESFQVFFGLLLLGIIETWIFYHAFIMHSGNFGFFVKGFIGGFAVGTFPVSFIKIYREEW
ncbi:MAG: hypothetical protein U9N35_03520 [Euryarchaeota archaeon]|nr:hypothetical protein [Euryarchaeota archaeon]